MTSSYSAPPSNYASWLEDNEPVTRIELKVDGVLISGAPPVEDPATGTFSATLSWVPGSRR